MRTRAIGRTLVWRLVAGAFAGTIAVAATMFALGWRVDHDVAVLITPGTNDVAAPVIAHDMPGYRIQAGAGHDGQAVYALAREPMHLHNAGQFVDRPRYRTQRILLPVLAWMVHPQGGGRGLAVAQWAVVALGVFLTGLGAGALAFALGASADASRRLALLAPLLPASWVCLGLSVPDQLALGLAMVALTLDTQRRHRSAVACAVLAVLAKETLLVLLLGWVVARGRATFVRLFAVPAAVAFTWWLTLRFVVFPHDHAHIFEIAVIQGTYSTLRDLVTGTAPLAGTVLVVSIGGALVAVVRRGLSSPLGWAIALQLAFTALLSETILGGVWNDPRATGPLLLLGIVALTIPCQPSPDLAELPLELVNLVA